MLVSLSKTEAQGYSFLFYNTYQYNNRGVYGDLLDLTTACFGENGFNLKLACGLKEKIIDSNLQFI